MKDVLGNGRGLTTRPPNDRERVDVERVDVVLLSKYNKRPHSSLTEFMKYVSHAHSLESILLQSSSLKYSRDTTMGMRCRCEDCQCVVFWATEEIMDMLDDRLPGTLKPLSGSRCLLPSLNCKKNGCHRCNDQTDVELGRLREDNPRVDSPAAVCEALNESLILDVEAAGESSELGTSEGRLREDNPAAVCEALNESLIEEEESSCICIPVHPRNADRWTKFMIKFLKSKEKEAKGIKVVVSDALQHYITASAQELGSLFQTPTGCMFASEIYERASLILPRVAEVIVNMVLMGWLRVDGFSSSLVARRAIRDYVVDSAGTGLGAHAFLTKAAVFFGDRCLPDVCQVVYFRGGLSARRVSYMVGCVNLLCAIAWSGLIAWKAKWAPSMPLSTPRVSVGVALGMDCIVLFGDEWLCLLKLWFWLGVPARAPDPVPVVRAEAEVVAEAKAQARALLGWLAILEVGCIVSLVVSLNMKKGLRRWVYSVMQVLVWVRWGFGSVLLGGCTALHSHLFWIEKGVTWVYCSAFLLNAMLAGVRGKWKYSI